MQRLGLALSLAVLVLAGTAFAQSLVLFPGSGSDAPSSFYPAPPPEQAPEVDRVRRSATSPRRWPADQVKPTRTAIDSEAEAAAVRRTPRGSSGGAMPRSRAPSPATVAVTRGRAVDDQGQLDSVAPGTEGDWASIDGVVERIAADHVQMRGEVAFRVAKVAERHAVQGGRRAALPPLRQVAGLAPGRGRQSLRRQRRRSSTWSTKSRSRRSPCRPSRSAADVASRRASQRSFSISPARQRVGAFVLGVAAMALHPDPVDLVRLARAASRRCHSSTFLTGFLSAVRQPFLFQPWIHLVTPSQHVLAVGVEPHDAGPLQRLQRPRSPPSAPCGCWSSPARRPTARVLALAHAQDRAPAARPGIAAAGAVGEELDLGLPSLTGSAHRP